MDRDLLLSLHEKVLSEIVSVKSVLPLDNDRIIKLEAIENLILLNLPRTASFVDVRFMNHGPRISDGSSLKPCYTCPNCNSHIFKVWDFDIHCRHCGQHIKWGDRS